MLGSILKWFVDCEAKEKQCDSPWTPNALLFEPIMDAPEMRMQQMVQCKETHRDPTQSTLSRLAVYTWPHVIFVEMKGTNQVCLCISPENFLSGRLILLFLVQPGMLDTGLSLHPHKLTLECFVGEHGSHGSRDSSQHIRAESVVEGAPALLADDESTHHDNALISGFVDHAVGTGSPSLLSL